MGILIAAVVLLTALTLFNLVLTLAIVRRLRATEAAPGRAASRAPDLDEVPVGAPVPDFTTRSVAGTPVSAAEQRGDHAVYAFFDTGCGVCEHQLRPLVDFARRAGLSPEQVVVFIADERGEAERYTSVVAEHTTVVLQAVDEVAEQVFGLRGVPAFVLADAEGTVVRSSVEVRDLAPALAGA
ncbi:TlpA family protein disulfide reductase [Nocardiopsis changdeensis]|uniref:TlpA family protein disulfide reductase n=1 Tax=Nocardiopsis changdeensis TaxID=2831969 RepID=UPI003F45599F